MPYDLCALNGYDLPSNPRLLTGAAFVAQRLLLRWSLAEGEVLRDASLYVPWLTWMQTRPFPRVQVRSTLLELARGVPGVAALTNVVDDYDPRAGTYVLRCRVQVDGTDDSIEAEVGNRGPDGNVVPWAAIILNGGT